MNLLLFPSFSYGLILAIYPPTIILQTFLQKELIEFLKGSYLRGGTR